MDDLKVPGDLKELNEYSKMLIKEYPGNISNTVTHFTKENSTYNKLPLNRTR